LNYCEKIFDLIRGRYSAVEEKKIKTKEKKLTDYKIVLHNTVGFRVIK